MRFITALLILFLGGTARAEPDNSATITLGGVLIVPPCTLAQDVINIDFGKIQLSDAIGAGTGWGSIRYDFLNCPPEASPYDTRITYNYESATNEYESNGCVVNSGTAKGVAICIMVGSSPDAIEPISNGYSHYLSGSKIYIAHELKANGEPVKPGTIAGQIMITLAMN